MSLAVVISDSFRKADQFTAGWGQAGTLANGINSILGSRFKKVVEAISLEAAKEKGTDLVAYLDGRVTYSMGILDTGTADVSARFTDLEGRTLETVSGKGIDKRFAGPVLPAAEAAVADFARNLDNASRLLAEAERISESARSTTADAPTPAAADRVRFPRTPLGVTFPKRNVRPDDVAVIVGNADYGKLGKTSPDVVPAYADAAGLKRYVTEALGVREGNVINLRDATGAQLVSVFGSKDNHRGQLYDWVRPGRSRVFVYYSGHGAPSGADGSAYLVPSDADGTRIDLNGYPLQTLYRNLGRLPATSVTVVLEACFSGASQGGAVISNASPVFLKAKTPPIPPNVTVISAGAANQMASWEKDKSQGLFTKYFLKAMAGEADAEPYGNGDGTVGLDELHAYLKETLTYYARRYYGRDQSAQIVVGKIR